MADIKLRNSGVLSDYGKPYIVAEMGTNHNGNMDKAKKMIDAAKESGCNCVKFQSWTSDTLYSKTVYEANPIAKRMVDRFSLSEKQLWEAAEYCSMVGIDFSSTPYSKQEVDFLVDNCKAPYVKIASMDLNNYPFLHYIAKKMVPIILSTGMADLDEIHKAVNTIYKTGNYQLCLLHCVAEYPPMIETIHLNNINTLRKEFPDCPIGFSDHSKGVEISTAAVALGTCLIEKHLTLDKSAPGWDNKMAMEPDEMRQLVQNCTNVFIAMGTDKRIIAQGELEQRKIIRRSIVAAHDLCAGTILKLEDLDCKRPGTGLLPERLENLIGMCLVRDIKADEMLKEDDVRPFI
ncbi:N-acylneuraminate-9-phosphate synthase [bacterium 1XD42-1]|nr:N-acylneuraminate-9-phosphate synthase [bacterium 1XD42-8]RKJ64571.1 N-acylneuraminate-9-phosphate synthase [bacterium 1XD42-1]